MTVDVKICGIRDEQVLRAAIKYGATYVGFVFYPASRNAIAPADAQKLAMMVPAHITRTGLFVDASDDELLTAIRDVPLDLIQLHGKETPERVTEVRELTNLPVMVAIRVTKAGDLEKVPAYEAVADQLLFDSRSGAEASGGPINWPLLKTQAFTKPWLLAGGINAQNIAEAVKKSGARGVDVSSGVEDSPGNKSPDKIRELLEMARGGGA